jgi:hypothetical protein
MSNTADKYFRVLVIKNSDESYCFKRLSDVLSMMKMLADRSIYVVHFGLMRTGREDWWVSAFAPNLPHSPRGDEALTLFNQIQ